MIGRQANINTAILLPYHAIIFSTPYNISTCFITISTLEKNKKKFVTENHNASYYNGLGQGGPGPSCPNPRGPSCLT